MERAKGTKKLAVIGDPIGHSFSPRIHGYMIEKLGLDMTYSAVQVKADELGGWIERALSEGYAGFNATMPHKEALIGYMDDLSPDAAMYGSVNTVRIRDGRLYGCNTDGDGFVLSLKDHGFEVEGSDVVIMGAGGAAKSIALKLASIGARSVTVLNRRVERAERICEKFPEICRAGELNQANLSGLAARCDLLVNCTPLGMEGVQGGFFDLSFIDGLKKNAVVCDLIYNPRATELLLRAKARGNRTINGLGMLIYQAMLAMEIYSDIKLADAKLKNEIEKILM